MAYPILEEEEWRIVDGFDRYMVSNLGRVVRTLGKRISAQGYPRVTLCDNNRQREVFIHRLVLETFVGPCPPGMEACHHPSNDRANARLDNLRWDTPSNNLADRIKHGTLNRGSRNGQSKLTEEQVLKIRVDERHPKVIAREYKVGRIAIINIKSRKRWGWLEDKERIT